MYTVQCVPLHLQVNDRSCHKTVIQLRQYCYIAAFCSAYTRIRQSFIGIIQAVHSRKLLRRLALQCKCAIEQYINSHLLKVRQPRCSDVCTSAASQQCPSHICDKNRTSKICMAYTRAMNSRNVNSVTRNCIFSRNQIA